VCYAPPCDRTGKMFPFDSRNHATGFWAIVVP
jgi:hypothetical protein